MASRRAAKTRCYVDAARGAARRDERERANDAPRYAAKMRAALLRAAATPALFERRYARDAGASCLMKYIVYALICALRVMLREFICASAAAHATGVLARCHAREAALRARLISVYAYCRHTRAAIRQRAAVLFRHAAAAQF